MLEWLVQTWEDFKFFAYQIVLTIGEFFKDIFIWIFEQVLSLVILILDGLSAMFDELNIASYINGIPSSVTYFASASGLSEAMGMIITALTIRFFLQLIPFVRWGS